MSPVLRPGRVTSKVNEGIINNSEIVIHTEEVQPISSSIVEPVESIVREEENDSQSSLEEIGTEEMKEEGEEKKDEKISAVLQELLDRKISKAIEGAEASLVVPQSEIISAEPHLVSPEVTEGVTSEINMPAVTMTADSASASVPQEVIPILGQEIHLPIAQEEIHPSVEPAVSVVSAMPIDVVPVPYNANTIPITVVTQEITPASSIPVATVTVATNIPAQAATQVATTPVAAVTTPKVHWFDKLFGNAPKAPPQSV